MRIPGLAVAAAAVMLSGAARADEDDVLALDRGLPITIEGVNPVERGSTDLRLRTQYDRQRDHRNLFTVGPEVEYGVAPGLSFSVNPTYSMGNAEEHGRGAVNLEAQYNILEVSGLRPGVGIVPQLSIPYGPGGEAVESALELRFTQPLGRAKTAPRLHLNVAWRHLYDAAEDERKDRYFAAAGVTLPVANTTALAFDVVREPSRERGKVDNFVEAGVRHALGDKTLLTAGAGAGLGPDSPRFRLLVGLQQSF